MKTKIRNLVMNFFEENVDDYNKEDVNEFLSAFLDELDHQLHLQNNPKRHQRKRNKLNKNSELEKCEKHSRIFQSFDEHKCQSCNTQAHNRVRRKWAGSTWYRNIRDQEGKPYLSLMIDVRPISAERSCLMLTNRF